MTIDWHYTMAWLPTSLLEHTGVYRHARQRCAYVFFHEMRYYATMVKIRLGLATLNSNNSVVYCQTHKVWVLVFLVRTSGIF